MNPDSPDGTAERSRWSACAEAWDRWADPMAGLAERLNRPLLDAAGLREGMRVLDLASGAGEPALSAAREVGAEGLVVGTDLVPGMLEGAARRAAGALLRPRFAAADMTRLPFAGAAFDAATCRFGIMFVPDAVGALGELRRVLRPGGRVALMVWGPRAENALFEIVGGAVEEQLGPDPQFATLFRFAEAGSLAALLAGAGFADVSETALTPVRKAPRAEAVWRPTLDMVFAHRLGGLGGAERAALEAEVGRRYEAAADGETVFLPAHVRIGVGRAG